MLHFNKLKLTGFKSFVEQIEIPVDPGLTGIVGPNGCGKSNLVEALRWVMGETSAKQMRGNEMEDVIFNGTSTRPPRNIAEVALGLDNSDRVAPAQFNEYTDLEVIRKIEREKGSTYRVNGKEVRARDVQLLFADSATGARSTAIVSQGRIGQIISQKPTDRRHLLEEAAGITGLHSRRHEAELRLRAAENNIGRLEDILATLELQFQGLKKQARQATRYKNLSEHIRKAEATLLYLKWIDVEAATGEAKSILENTENTVNELTRQTANASLIQTKAAGNLPELRTAEAKSAAELQRLTIARDDLGKEEARMQIEQEDCTIRLDQVNHDIEREKGHAKDAAKAIKRLELEHENLDKSQDDEKEILRSAAEKLSEINKEINSLDREQTYLTEKLAGDEAQRISLEHVASDLSSQLEQLTKRIETTETQHLELLEKSRETSEIIDTGAELDTAKRNLEATRKRIDTADADRENAMASLESARSLEQEARTELTRLEAEESALSDLLDNDCSKSFPPLIDALDVEQGFERAMGAALGDDLSAPVDEPSTVHWRTLNQYSSTKPLPAGVETLSDKVSGHKALTRRLTQVGVVADVEAGFSAQTDLQQGQRLVSRDGWLWRWDGFTISPDAATGAAKRLEQRNRLNDIRSAMEKTRNAAAKAERGTEKNRKNVEMTNNIQREAREAARESENYVSKIRERQATIKEQIAVRSSRIAALEEQLTALNVDYDDILRKKTTADVAVQNLPNTDNQRALLEEVRGKLSKCRVNQTECQTYYSGLVSAADDRKKRLTDAKHGLHSWRSRKDGAHEQMKHLEMRHKSLEIEQERLKSLPSAIKVQQFNLTKKIEDAEKKRQNAADNLVINENKASDAGRTLREFENALAEARESRIRAEGIVEQHLLQIQSITERVTEKLQVPIEGLADLIGIEDDTKLPDIESADRRVERLIKERDTMGPVNLRAAQEAEELTTQIDTLNSERDDLLAAIDKLRKGVSELNREGRERLLSSFHEVDAHFQELFVKLFGGGKAHLSLAGSEDPLESGLEIMASPPGKKLQVLSLLSGGESALTATALLFAVFLTNPAPICVLDEVDAPLDDANVERFCNMVDMIAHTSGTRFIVITHHRMTMARMDRLFGVTMIERGISRLVSVDLQQAEEIKHADDQTA